MLTSMNDSIIISGCRTPIGKFLGELADVPAPRLGAVAIAGAVARAKLGNRAVDEVIMGNVLAAGLGQAPARQAALLAGLPPEVSALTINMMCGSGLRAVMLADQAIRAGNRQVVVAGGMENMSRAPFVLNGARQGWKLGPQTAVDTMIHDGLWCAFENAHMGNQAEYIAEKCGVSRADQDAFSLESHRRAVASADLFADEIVPVTVDRKGGAVEVRRDEGPRSDTSLETLAKLRPSFDKAGSVTAGNASQISDGAAAVVVASRDVANEISVSPKFRIVACADSGVPPKELFIAPVSAMQKVLALAKLTVTDIDLFEINEAFAAQCLACARPLEIPVEKLNVRGGAVALGHPIGASGARVLVTLMHTLAAENKSLGLASLCLGGGNAVAMIVERVV
jgi:acetyl-CoA C-acetyltransferase